MVYNVPSRYKGFWDKMKASADKRIVIECPRPLQQRLIKGMRKQQTNDYDFKAENAADPYTLRFKYDDGLRRMECRLVKKFNI